MVQQWYCRLITVVLLVLFSSDSVQFAYNVFTIAYCLQDHHIIGTHGGQYSGGGHARLPESCHLRQVRVFPLAAICNFFYSTLMYILLFFYSLLKLSKYNKRVIILLFNTFISNFTVLSFTLVKKIACS